MAIAGIEQIDNSGSNVNVSANESGSSSTGSGRENILSVILLIMVFVLLGLFAYLFFTDRLVVGIENPFSSGENQSTINQQEEVIKTGEFHLTMGYPSEYLPPYRVCFSDVTDISKVYCFVNSGSEESSSEYKNTVVEGVGVLPVGEYTMEYKLLEDVDHYIWNPCIKALNGGEVTDESVCSDFYSKLEQSYLSQNGLDFNSSYVNSYGGDPIVISIEEDERTEIGDVASMPYFDFSYLLQD